MKTKNKIPMRQCTGCREMKSKKEMLRVLKTTEDEIVLDTTGKKNGRGAYLCLSRECLDKAIKNHGLERSLKLRFRMRYTNDLRRSWKILKNNRVLSLIGLATKAGKTVSGEFSTEKSVKTGKGLLVIVAEDASENTKKKFRNMCSFYEVPIFFFSDKESLGRAMGKEYRACLAVQDENFAKAIMKEV